MGVTKRVTTTKQQQKPKGGLAVTDYKDGATDEFEFGGSLGALGLMIGFPLLMWYMWIGATHYDGHLPSAYRRPILDSIRPAPLQSGLRRSVPNRESMDYLLGLLHFRDGYVLLHARCDELRPPP